MREREREKLRQDGAGGAGGPHLACPPTDEQRHVHRRESVGGVFEGDFAGSAPGGCAVQDGDEHAEQHQEDCQPR